MKVHGIQSSIGWRRRNSRIHEEILVSIWIKKKKKKGFAAELTWKNSRERGKRDSGRTGRERN